MLKITAASNLALFITIDLCSHTVLYLPALLVTTHQIVKGPYYEEKIFKDFLTLGRTCFEWQGKISL